jgi:hypothetical protein
MWTLSSRICVRHLDTTHNMLYISKDDKRKKGKMLSASCQKSNSHVSLHVRTNWRSYEKHQPFTTKYSPKHP